MIDLTIRGVFYFDFAVAAAVYEKAIRKGINTTVKL
jgi:ornithine cyclodeaminase/alanine dehydrogenase-like protein (mu-crystallin family)